MIVTMLLALILAMAHSGVPVVAAAEAPLPSISYRTTIVQRFESFGQNGTLTLWFPASGYVRGTYTPDDGGSAPMPVTGGREGTKIWLDFAALGRLHVEGTVDGGVIRGLGSKQSSSKVFVFTATPRHTTTSQGAMKHATSSSTRR